MADTDVDVSSLDDFLANLANRRAQLETVIAKMNQQLADKAPALGTFQHAESSKAVYVKHYGEFADRVNRLMEAVVAAELATKRIAENYRTAEQLNTLTADGIGERLDDVDTALENK